MSYRIGSFNCLNFGRASQKDLQVFVDIIQRERFDIVALQEIKGKKALDMILNRLGLSWQGMADDGYVNDYAFIWNTNRIRLAESEEGTRKKTYQPRIYKQYKVDRKSGQRDLIRDPYYARFYPTGGGAPFIEIRIMNCHLRFTKGDSEVPFGAIQMRKNEFDVLTKAIYAKEADKRYGTNRPAYLIMLGDYNLNLPSSLAGAPYLLETFEIDDGKCKKQIKTLQNNLTTLKKELYNEKKEDNFANNYDHFTIDEIRFKDVTVQCRKVDAIKKYCDEDYERYKKEVSDHLPISMDLNIRKG